MSAACSQALGLPEIVAAILEQLHHRKSLFAALQVNRLWADEATMVLWRVDPPVQGLVQISNVERRQYYANKISSLRITWPDESEWDQLLNTCFPRLSNLSTSMLDEAQEQCLYHFLQPTLRKLGCFGWPLRFGFLLQIATRCPDLSVLSLTWPPELAPTCDLVWFLDLMPSLTQISLYNIANVEIYLHLASRPNLQKLSITGPTLTENATMRILATVTNPYLELRCLNWRAQGKGFHCLARHLSSLNVLELVLVDPSDDILFAISDCTNLARMDVRLATDSHVPAEGLLAVARKCSQLRFFILCGTAKVDGRSITDDVIRQVVTYLPTMTSFKIDIRMTLTITALICLGEQCTKLEGFYLRGDFDLEQLWRPNLAPLFPRLKCLELRKVSENVPYERAVSILLQQCPRLRLPMIYKGSSSGDWIKSAWRIIKED